MNYRSLLFPVGIILFLVVLTQSILQAKLFQLRVSVSRERLMNFELSSKILRARFRDIFKSNDDYRAEINRNLVEADILNNVTVDDLDSGYLVGVGIAVSNAIRTMSLKPFLRLQEERRMLLILKYAFFMERNQRLKIASQKYSDVIRILEEQENDIVAFSLLHLGFCLASLGKRPAAIIELKKIIDIFPGSHFARTAVVLLNILLEREQTSKRIEKKKLSAIEKARIFYTERIYDQACENYKKSFITKSSDRYNWGRCNEEIGNQKRAIGIYKKLANGAKISQSARFANRRLLLLGSFYRAGDDLTKIAQKNSVRLGDKSVVDEIGKIAKEKREDVVVKEIVSGLKESDPTKKLNLPESLGGGDLLKEIGEELTKNVAVKKELKIELDKELQKKEKKIEIVKPEPEAKTLAIDTISESNREDIDIRAPEKVEEEERRDPSSLTPVMHIVLQDGRRLTASEVSFNDGLFYIKGKIMASTIPRSQVSAIISRWMEKKQKKDPKPMKISISEDKEINATSIRVIAKDNIFRIDGKEYPLSGKLRFFY